MCWIHIWNFCDRDITKFGFSSFSTFWTFAQVLYTPDLIEKSHSMILLSRPDWLNKIVQNSGKRPIVCNWINFDFTPSWTKWTNNTNFLRCLPGLLIWFNQATTSSMKFLMFYKCNVSRENLGHIFGCRSGDVCQVSEEWKSDEIKVIPPFTVGSVKALYLTLPRKSFTSSPICDTQNNLSC